MNPISFLLLISMAISVSSQSHRRLHFDMESETDFKRNGTIDAEEDFHPMIRDSAECQQCRCPLPPTCPPGISLLLDGCGCCKICARQLGQDCDLTKICDVHKNLYCDVETRTCRASPGRPCNVGGRWYENGEMFHPSCRAACFCIDGDLGCVPTCNTPQSSPASLDCSHPKLIRRKGQCCGEWVCLKNGKLEKDMLPYENQVKGHQKMHVTFKGSCMVQTTSWSPCSRTCGFGISDRVTNDNKDCELRKETRLCNLRPCSAVQRRPTSRKRCRKNLRHNKRVRFSLSGCLSNTTYRPRYCGTCANKCCDPQSAKTVTITFTCKDSVNATSSFSRNMMMIKKCHCHECIQGNDIFSAVYTGLDGDMFQTET